MTRASEPIEQGEQVLIDGIAPITARDRLAALAALPMRPKRHPNAVRAQRIGWYHGRALLAEGRDQEALADVEGRLAAYPNDPTVIEDWMLVKSIGGADEEVRRFMAENWESAADMQALFGYYYLPSPLHIRAAVQRDLGDEEGLADTMRVWSARLALMRGNGWAGPLMDLEEALFAAIKGDLGLTRAKLDAARAAGLMDPLVLHYPAFRPFVADIEPLPRAGN